ncbi:phosphoglycerate mutase (2,3-diphosphoglycerate-independent), partial [Candidatus Kryptonium thompsonii]
IEYIRQFEAKANEIGVGKIAVVGGRYYGMDRDNRWERTEKYYKAMTEAQGEKFKSAEEGILKSYEKGITDEFVVPFIIVDENGNPVGQVRDGDSVIFFNFRADRARQLTRAFIDENFDKFNRRKINVHFVTMTEYNDDFNVPIAFKPVYLTNTLGEIISKYGFKQLRIAETEKYAHVTYFFSGGREDPFEGEDRILIPSPKVATYDLKPEMSAFEVTDKVIEEMEKNKYALIVLNFANPDMVGHTGVIPAAVKAIEAIDTCIGRIYNSAKKNNYVMIITADHGNAEKMIDPETNEPHTAHTTNQVPFILVMDEYKGELKKDGKLGDIAPTILTIMNLPIPPEMDGEILLLEKVPYFAK